MEIYEKMRYTVNYAEKALKSREMPIAAVIFSNDQVIAEAYTSEYTDARFLVHAELKTLLEVDKKKYSVKERKNMQLFTTLEPCMMCLGASLSSFIGEIHYALEAKSDGAVHLLDALDQPSEINSFSVPKIHSGMMRYETLNLFKKYIEIAPAEGLRKFAKGLLDQEG